MLTVGEPAPEFALKDQNNQVVSLADFRGVKNVLLVFYPYAFTRVCEGELCAIRDDLGSFENDDVQVLTVSVDTVFAHKVWAEREGFTFPLLADFWPHGAVSRAYGCFDEVRGCSTRGAYVIDTAGVLRWLVVNAIPDARDQAEYLAVLAGV
jgi:peroxiredoxin